MHKFYLKCIEPKEDGIQAKYKILAVKSRYRRYRESVSRDSQPGQIFTLEDIANVLKNGHEVHIAPVNENHVAFMEDPEDYVTFLAPGVTRKESK